MNNQIKKPLICLSTGLLLRPLTQQRLKKLKFKCFEFFPTWPSIQTCKKTDLPKRICSVHAVWSHQKGLGGRMLEIIKEVFLRKDILPLINISFPEQPRVDLVTKDMADKANVKYIIAHKPVEIERFHQLTGGRHKHFLIEIMDQIDRDNLDKYMEHELIDGFVFDTEHSPEGIGHKKARRILEKILKQNRLKHFHLKINTNKDKTSSKNQLISKNNLDYLGLLKKYNYSNIITLELYPLFKYFFRQNALIEELNKIYTSINGQIEEIWLENSKQL